MTRNGALRAWQTARPAFRVWRRNRPFWGGLLIILAGVVIVAAPALNPLPLIVQQGIAGISGYFAGVLLMAVGVLAWLQPPQRFFYGIAAIMLALVSFITSNFGGFVFGMLFGLIGGALTVAWVPDRKRKAARPRRGRRGGGGSGESGGPAGGAGTAPVGTGAEAAAREEGPADEADDAGRDRGGASAPGDDRERADGEHRDSRAESAVETGAAPAGEAAGQRGSELGGGPLGGRGGGSGGGSSGGAASGQHRRSAGGGTPEASVAAKSGGASWHVEEPWSETGGSSAGGRDTGGPAGGSSGRSPGGDRLHSLAAVAAALVIAVPAPATVSWPWDDWFGGDEETPAPSPTPTSTPSPSSSPSAGPGGAGEDGEGGGEGQQDGAGGADDGGEDAPAAEKCTVQSGPATMGEQEYRSLLEACSKAQEQGKRPQFDVQESDGRWLAHTEPSGLTADKLSMQGAAFEGVVEYPVEGGTVRYLKLSMDTAEFTGASQWSEHGGASTSLEIPEMTMSGDVVMHVTRMKVRILGIPLEFTPSFPPPLLLPSMTVTDLEADQPLAQADTVEIPEMDERVEAL